MSPEQLVSPGDIAIYGTLCALSSLSRNAIKSQILENSTFAAYIEHEPYIRELIEAYIASDFKAALEILSRYSVGFVIPSRLNIC
jgi:COP9 signalosome complex subunit 1